MLIVVQVMYGLAAVLNVLWTFVFRSWVVTLAVFYLIPAAMCLWGIVYFVVDTPMSLVTKYPAEKALQGF